MVRCAQNTHKAAHTDVIVRQTNSQRRWWEELVAQLVHNDMLYTEFEHSIVDLVVDGRYRHLRRRHTPSENRISTGAR